MCDSVSRFCRVRGTTRGRDCSSERRGREVDRRRKGKVVLAEEDGEISNWRESIDSRGAERVEDEEEKEEQSTAGVVEVEIGEG